MTGMGVTVSRDEEGGGAKGGQSRHVWMSPAMMMMRVGSGSMTLADVCMFVAGRHNAPLRRMLSRRHGDREGAAVRGGCEPEHGPIGEWEVLCEWWRYG